MAEKEGETEFELSRLPHPCRRCGNATDFKYVQEGSDKKFICEKCGEEIVVDAPLTMEFCKKAEGEFQKRIKKVVIEYCDPNWEDSDLCPPTGFSELMSILWEFKKEFLSLNTEKPIHKDYWTIFEKWFGT